MIKLWRDQNTLRMLLIGILILIIYSFILVPLEVLNLPRWKSRDIATVLRHALLPQPKNIENIIIISIDDISLKKMGKKWPWPRRTFAELLEKLNSYQPELISFDLVFTGVSSAEDDKLLAQAIKKSRNVFMASFFDEKGEHVLPYEPFLQSGAETAFINKPQDDDFRVRNTWGILFSPQYEVKDYSFEIKVAARYAGAPADKITFDGRNITFEDVRIPARRDGTMSINYRADFDDFTVVPFWKVMQEEVPFDNLRNKIVLVGAEAEAIHDIYLTPFGPMPGVGICANNILMLINGTSLRELPAAVSFIILLIFALLLAFFSYNLAFFRSALFSVAFTAGFLLLYFGLSLKNYTMDYFAVVFVGISIFIFAGIFKYFRLSLTSAQLRKLVVTDISTGLFIYRYFRFRLQAEVIEAIRSKSNISLAIFSIDNFRKISDDYGIEQANLILRAIAQMLKENSPRGALLARYGENKFSLLLKLKYDEVLKLGEKLREEIEELEVSGAAKDLKLIFSIGVASYPHVAINSSRDLIRCAEAALKRGYKRNEVCVFDSKLDKVHLGAQEKKPGAEVGYIASDYLEDMYRDLNTTLKELRQAHKDMETAFFEFIRSLVKALEAKDTYTAGHSDRVRKYALMLAEALGMPEEERKLISQAALLHDIGKIGMPESILRKTDKLSNEEYAIVKQHSEAGVRILEPIEFFRKYIPLILHHHERYDGTGYPHGIGQDLIPAGAAIISIADAFDAMTTGRTYTIPKTTKEAIAELRKGSGKQFKPLYVEKFIQALAVSQRRQYRG
ncbi:MAG: CHASE2 domain-containing protein [Candidatus Omnitrophota bacterium]|nr:MAG: CHASE2 domain-containing protein [Candidatus Omnitrophota bacterium]